MTNRHTIGADRDTAQQPDGDSRRSRIVIALITGWGIIGYAVLRRFLDPTLGEGVSENVALVITVAVPAAALATAFLVKSVKARRASGIGRMFTLVPVVPLAVLAAVFMTDTHANITI